MLRFAWSSFLTECSHVGITFANVMNLVKELVRRRLLIIFLTLRESSQLSMLAEMLTYFQSFFLTFISFLTFTPPIFKTRTQGAFNDFEARCNLLQPEAHVLNSTRRVVEYVPAGTSLSFPDEDVSCGKSSQVIHVDLCRVALSIQTSNTSSVETEMWLPRNWSGRFLGTGNGGLGGC